MKYIIIITSIFTSIYCDAYQNGADAYKPFTYEDRTMKKVKEIQDDIYRGEQMRFNQEMLKLEHKKVYGW